MKENILDAPLFTEPPFVGREEQFEQFERLFDSTCSGKGVTVFVHGEAGAGKSRFVKEFLKRLSKREITIGAGSCISKTPVPYFPFIEAFNTIYSPGQDSNEPLKESIGIMNWLRGEEIVEVESLGLKGWLKGSDHHKAATRRIKLSAEMRKDMTYAAVLKSLLSISRYRPLVLFIDDLHWADSASLALLHYISRAIGQSKVLIVGTFRTEEVSQECEGHPNPLGETLTLMRREGIIVEVKMPNLDKPEVVKLAEFMLKGSVEAEFVERLSIDSQGNPLFAVESVRMLIESGNLSFKNGIWRNFADDLSIPARVKDVILYRLNRLNSIQRRMLDLGSIIGERFDPALLESVLSQDKLVILETLNVIARSTLLIHPVENVFKFGHGKFREVLYEEMSLPLRREYHQRVAEKIENSNREPSDLPINDLAYHYVQAGNREKSIFYSIAAGTDALKRFSNSEASRHFEYVLKTVQEDSEYTIERTTALEGLGDASSAMGAFEEAAKAFERLSNVSKSGEVRLRALRKAMIASFNKGDMPHALSLADQAEKDSGFDRLEYAMVQMYRTKTNVFRATIAGSNAIRELESCLRVFEEMGSLSSVADALLEIGSVQVTETEDQKALNVLQRSIDLYEKMGNYRKQVEAYFWMGMGHFSVGRHQQALEVYKRIIEIGAKIGDYNRMAWARLYSSLLHESLWELKEGLEDSLEGVSYAEKTDSYYIQSAIYTSVARLSAKLGDSRYITEYTEKFEKSFAVAGPLASKTLKAGGVRTQAVLFAAKGQMDEANNHFEKCLGLYRGALATTLHEAMARTDYAWALAKQGRIDDAGMQIDEAKKLYGKLGNKSSIERLSIILSEFEKHKQAYASAPPFQ